MKKEDDKRKKCHFWCSISLPTEPGDLITFFSIFYMPNFHVNPSCGKMKLAPQGLPMQMVDVQILLI